MKLHLIYKCTLSMKSFAFNACVYRCLWHGGVCGRLASRGQRDKKEKLIFILKFFFFNGYKHKETKLSPFTGKFYSQRPF